MMVIMITTIRIYISQWQEGRKHCYCLKLPVSTPTHDFPGCPVAYFNLMVDVKRVFVGGQILRSCSFLALVCIHWLLKYF